MFYGDLREYFAVKVATGFLERIEEATVGEPVEAHSVIEALNPEFAHRTLLDATVAVSIASGLEECFVGGALMCRSAPAKAFDLFEDIFAVFERCCSAFNSCHRSSC